MKSTIALTLLICTSLLIGGIAVAGAGYDKQKVVYHINYDNPKAQAGALRNIQNHINAVGEENLELKVVMHGKGLSLLLTPDQLENTKLKRGNATDKMQTKIIVLKNQGVGFQVCANTLKGKKINYEDDLFDVDEADIVPSGVAEVAKLQAEGYSYIKP